jgi:SAM-dependent methyltransferase/uncharacterized protein YbaR (Trm112 family)
VTGHRPPKAVANRVGERLRAVLICPYDGLALESTKPHRLGCPRGHEFPIVDGVPVLLREDVPATIDVARASLARLRPEEGETLDPAGLYLDTLGVSAAERTSIARLAQSGTSAIDPVVQYLVGATCGRAYRDVTGRLADYPIPEIRLPRSSGERLVDIGCNWGRWSIAAARKGYAVIGLDPQLGAVLAARRVSHSLGLDAAFVCADARHLPIAPQSVDVIFSYSVLQHFGEDDLSAALDEIRRVLRDGGTSMVQMANAWGLRNACVIARRGARPARDFEVRYRSPSRLKAMFSGRIGPTSVSADCFLGLGLQVSDRMCVSALARAAITASEVLKRVARRIPRLAQFADSIYLRSTKGFVR